MKKVKTVTITVLSILLAISIFLLVFTTFIRKNHENKITKKMTIF